MVEQQKTTYPFSIFVAKSHAALGIVDQPSILLKLMTGNLSFANRHFFCFNPRL